MFLIEGLDHKLVSKTKSSSLHRHYRADRQQYMDAMERLKIWFACAKCVHMFYVFLRLQFAEGLDGKKQTLTATLGIQASTSLFAAANWPNSTDGGWKRISPRIKLKRSTASSLTAQHEPIWP